MSRFEPVPGAIDPLAARPANESEAAPAIQAAAGTTMPPVAALPPAASSQGTPSAPAPASAEDASQAPASPTPPAAGQGAGEPPPPALPPALPLGAPVPARGRDIALGALATAIVLLGLATWDAHRDRNDLRQELAQRLSASDELGRQAQTTAQGAQRTVRELEVALEAVQGQLAESQSQQLALEALYQDLARGRDEAALAEIEQSLITANQQLVLAGNVRVALIALQSADARLALIDRAQFAPLRRALAADIERLQRVPMVDTAGIAMRLDRAVAGLDALEPLPGGSSPGAGAAGAPSGGASGVPEQAGPAAPGGWRATLARLWAEFKADFRQLASIRRIDSDALPLITPEQSWFLRENLRLRLLSARHALLARDESGFRGDITAARAWVARYFDPRDPGTVALAETLGELERAQVRIDLPEMAASIEAVRSLRVSRDRRQ
jgi:uroporphyrin-3 C-methyltransferase